MISLRPPSSPKSIAHRGASAYAAGNSMRAFEIAAELGADYWEIDVQETSDAVLVVHHDDFPVDVSFQDFRNKFSKSLAPTLLEVLEFAKQKGAGVYLDIKNPTSAARVLDLLVKLQFSDAIIAVSDLAAVAMLQNLPTPYPVSYLTRSKQPLSFIDAKPDMIHLCWENFEPRAEGLDPEFFARCAAENLSVVLWHEEDPERMKLLRELPVFGICSNTPELVNPARFDKSWPVGIVCHRGANKIAPENTLPAANACFAAGFSHVEIDVRVTKDRQLVVFHDDRLERTTSGAGLVKEKTFDEMSALSAGAWFSDHFANTKVPKFEEILGLAVQYNKSLYIELKDAPPALIWQAVERFGMQENCFFWSFELPLLHELRSITSQARIMMRRQDFPSLKDALDCLAPSIIEYCPNDDWSELSKFSDEKTRSMIAYKGDDQAIFQKIVAASPNYVNLDEPFKFVQFCKELELCNRG